MQGNWENWRNSFWWSANREFFLSENDFKRSSEIQKFSRENVDIFWWSANRDKFCKVVRESEKVENRCSSSHGLIHLCLQTAYPNTPRRPPNLNHRQSSSFAINVVKSQNRRISTRDCIQ